jgi:hypothetical protein
MLSSFLHQFSRRNPSGSVVWASPTTPFGQLLKASNSRPCTRASQLTIEYRSNFQTTNLIQQEKRQYTEYKKKKNPMSQSLHLKWPDSKSVFHQNSL